MEDETTSFAYLTLTNVVFEFRSIVRHLATRKEFNFNKCCI